MILQFLRAAGELASLVAGGVNRFVGGLAEGLQLGWDATQVGMCSGAILLGFLGFIVFRIRIWWQGILKFFKKQSVRHETAKTPSQVGVDSCLSLIAIILFIAVLVLAVVLYAGVNPQ